MKHLCRGDEAVAAAVEAISTLEPLGETHELARAYATLAALRMTRNENDEAIELARRAEALARSLGASDVIADALNTEGCAASATDPSWVDLIRRSLELAVFPATCPIRPAVPTATCTASRETSSGSARESSTTATASPTASRTTWTASYFRAQPGPPSWNIVGAGTLAIGAELLEESSAAPLNQICVQALIGVIHARRGEPEAWRALDSAIASAAPTDSRST